MGNNEIIEESSESNEIETVDVVKDDEKLELIKKLYNDGKELSEKASTTKEWKEVCKKLEKIRKYKDADQVYLMAKEHIKAANKKVSKILSIAVGIVAIVAIVAFVSVKYVMPYLPHYTDANKAYKEAKYEDAIAEYQLAGTFLNSETKLEQCRYDYAKHLMETNCFVAAAKQLEEIYKVQDSAELLKTCAETLRTDKKYSDASDIYAFIGTHSDDLNSTYYSKYCRGMDEYLKKNYGNAKSDFAGAGGVENSKDMQSKCDLYMAEAKYQDGKLNAAKDAFSKLPEDLKDGDVSVKDRLDLLNKCPLLSIVGEYYVKKSHIEVRNVWNYDGRWDSWYNDNLDWGSLTINCIPNAVGTYTIKGSVSFWRFNDYSVLAAYVNPVEKTVSFTIPNVTTFPSSYKVDQYTTLSYSNGVFKIKYSERDDYSVNFHNMYLTDATFEKKTSY